jgi:hypothetical protein
MSANSNIKLLDLDDIVAPEVVVKLKGKEHRLAPLTVKLFIENTKLIQAMGTTGSIDDEIGIARAMLRGVFPTLSVEDFDELSLDQMNALIDFAMKANGQKDMEEKVGAEAEGNPPKAGE